ncbi:MAG: hypothetical protein WBD14_12180, partial [Phycisphaerae bacterium]
YTLLVIRLMVSLTGPKAVNGYVAEVTEQRTGKVIARHTDRLTVTTRRGETLLWRIKERGNTHE